MRKFLLSFCAVVMVFGMMGMTQGYAFSLPGTNITIPDRISSSPSGTNRAHEDNEVEQNALIAQSWDNEAFFLDHSTNLLTLVSGWDFIGGLSGFQDLFFTGDIFIDIHGDAVFPLKEDHVMTAIAAGSGTSGKIDINGQAFDWFTQATLDTKWEFALQPVKFTPGPDSFEVEFRFYEITPSTKLLVAKNGLIKSSPWSVDKSESIFTTLQGKYFQNLMGTQVGGFLDWDGAPSDSTGTPDKAVHNALQVDLDMVFNALGAENPYGVGAGYAPSAAFGSPLFRFTQSCGNDVVVGQDSVPEPGTLLLLGVGLLGILVLGRKRLLK